MWCLYLQILGSALYLGLKVDTLGVIFNEQGLTNLDSYTIWISGDIMLERKVKYIIAKGGGVESGSMKLLRMKEGVRVFDTLYSRYADKGEEMEFLYITPYFYSGEIVGIGEDLRLLSGDWVWWRTKRTEELSRYFVCYWGYLDGHQWFGRRHLYLQVLERDWFRSGRYEIPCDARMFYRLVYVRDSFREERVFGVIPQALCGRELSISQVPTWVYVDTLLEGGGEDVWVKWGRIDSLWVYDGYSGALKARYWVPGSYYLGMVGKSRVYGFWDGEYGEFEGKRRRKKERGSGGLRYIWVHDKETGAFLGSVMVPRGWHFVGTDNRLNRLYFVEGYGKGGAVILYGVEVEEYGSEE